MFSRFLSALRKTFAKKSQTPVLAPVESILVEKPKPDPKKKAPLRFTDLPSEIRNIIYEYVVTTISVDVNAPRYDDLIFHDHPMQYLDTHDPSRDPAWVYSIGLSAALPLFHTNRQIRSEAISYMASVGLFNGKFVNYNTFTVPEPTSRCGNLAPWLAILNSLYGSYQQRKICHDASTVPAFPDRRPFLPIAIKVALDYNDYEEISIYANRFKGPCSSIFAQFEKQISAVNRYMPEILSMSGIWEYLKQQEITKQKRMSILGPHNCDHSKEDRYISPVGLALYWWPDPEDPEYWYIWAFDSDCHHDPQVDVDEQTGRVTHTLDDAIWRDKFSQAILTWPWEAFYSQDGAWQLQNWCAETGHSIKPRMVDRRDIRAGFNCIPSTFSELLRETEYESEEEEVEEVEEPYRPLTPDQVKKYNDLIDEGW